MTEPDARERTPGGEPPEPAEPPRPAAPASGSAGVGRLLLALRVAVPIALAIVGYAVLGSQRWTIDHELQLVAPEAVRPGDPIPVRALVFDGADDPEGGALVPARVDVALRDAADRTLAETTLEPSATATSEGALEPRALEDGVALRLVAQARTEDGEVVATASRPLLVAADAPPAPLTGRIGLPLAHLDLGPITAEATGVPLPPLDVRVAGGTCVPEEPCELWIDAGDADEVTIDDTPAVSVAQRSSRDGGLVQLVVVPHGPEAAIDLTASRLGQPLARRTVRLPIALATPWLHALRVVRAEPIAIEAHAPPGRDSMILDVFRDGRWIRTATIAPATTELPAPLDAPGLYLLQLRADAYGSGERAATRYVLYAPEGSSGVSLDRARALLAAAGVELADPEATDPRMLLAGAEEEARTLPAAVSGLEEDRARLAARRHRLYVIATIALLLGIAVLATTLLRRGLGAAEQARDVMSEAGDPDARSARTRARMTVAVLAIVGAVALALLAGAATILARAAIEGW